MLKMKFFANGVQRRGRREILSQIKANIWVCREKISLGLPFFLATSAARVQLFFFVSFLFIVSFVYEVRRNTVS